MAVVSTRCCLAVLLTALALSSVVSSSGALARGSAGGFLLQLPGGAGCVSSTGDEGACVKVKALLGPYSLAVAADGKTVYVAAWFSHAVAVFDRDAIGRGGTPVGQLAQPAGVNGCISETGSDGACTDGKTLRGPYSLAVNPKGGGVYVASSLSDAVAVFTRFTTGKLVPLLSSTECKDCGDAAELDGVRAIALSPDAKNVYVASGERNAVVGFKRWWQTAGLVGGTNCISNSGNGTCIDGFALRGPSSVVVSPDGRHVYVASAESRAVVGIERETESGRMHKISGSTGCISNFFGTCGEGRMLEGVSSIAISPDGRNVYAASPVENGVAVFARNALTGRLTQLWGLAGCVRHLGSFSCAAGRALKGARALTLSPDGKNLYVAASVSDAVAVFERDPATGKLTQLPGTAGCTSDDGDGGCANGKGLDGASSVAISPDGKSVYVGAVAAQVSHVAVFARHP